MINLKQVIEQLSNQDAEKISAQFKASNAHKFLSLFNYYRTNGQSDSEIRDKLNENPRSFYVLKSRLYDKIQEHLLENLESPKSDILKKTSSIPELLLNTNRNRAMSILTRLEDQLNEYDMPNELTTVYSALKKISRSTEKFYHYSQLYNKHVAYTLSLDKADDLVGDFIMRLGEYFLSRDDSMINLFRIIREEMDSTCRLYQSHHLQFHQNILNASYGLFLSHSDDQRNQEPVEDILRNAEKIIQSYPKDSMYRYLKYVIYFLFFEYYHALKIHKKEDQYYDILNASLPHLLYYNFYCIPTKFLISKIERHVQLGTESRLHEENRTVFKNYEPDNNDVPNFIQFTIYLAVSAYYAKEHKTAAKQLQNLVNVISFKNYVHAEMETKLLLVLCYLLAGEYDLSWNLLKNTKRKIYEINKSGDYENALSFSKLMEFGNPGQQTRSAKEALVKFRKRFELTNTGQHRMLQYLKMDDHFMEALSRPLK